MQLCHDQAWSSICCYCVDVVFLQSSQRWWFSEPSFNRRMHTRVHEGKAHRRTSEELGSKACLCGLWWMCTVLGPWKLFHPALAIVKPYVHFYGCLFKFISETMINSFSKKTDGNIYFCHREYFNLTSPLRNVTYGTYWIALTKNAFNLELTRVVRFVCEVNQIASKRQYIYRIHMHYEEDQLTLKCVYFWEYFRVTVDECGDEVDRSHVVLLFSPDLSRLRSSRSKKNRLGY